MITDLQARDESNLVPLAQLFLLAAVPRRKLWLAVVVRQGDLSIFCTGIPSRRMVYLIFFLIIAEKEVQQIWIGGSRKPSPGPPLFYPTFPCTWLKKSRTSMWKYGLAPLCKNHIHNHTSKSTFLRKTGRLLWSNYGSIRRSSTILV